LIEDKDMMVASIETDTEVKKREIDNGILENNTRIEKEREIETLCHTVETDMHLVVDLNIMEEIEVPMPLVLHTIHTLEVAVIGEGEVAQADRNMTITQESLVQLAGVMSTVQDTLILKELLAQKENEQELLDLEDENGMMLTDMMEEAEVGATKQSPEEAGQRKKRWTTPSHSCLLTVMLGEISLEMMNCERKRDSNENDKNEKGKTENDKNENDRTERNKRENDRKWNVFRENGSIERDLKGSGSNRKDWNVNVNKRNLKEEPVRSIEEEKMRTEGTGEMKRTKRII
jgi:hypothetical protein